MIRGNSATATTASGARIEYDWGQGIREWFINDARGLEQGWTIVEPPGAAGQSATGISMTFSIHGGLTPRIERGGKTITFTDGAGAGALDYGGLKAWDADGRPLEADFVEAVEGMGTHFHIRVDDHAARYPITIDPIAQQTYLKASNAETGDAFGRAVAVSGDTVVIGAPLEDSGASGVNGNQSGNTANGAGAAYVFVRNGAAWTQQAYLKASNTGAGDSFGHAVAISGNTIVVGAYQESSDATSINGVQSNDNANASGAVYVFTRTAGVWTQQAYLKSANSGPGDWLGYSVAIAGDTLVAGAPYEDSESAGVNGDGANNGLTSSGAAYVFVRTGTTWTQQAYLKAASPSGSDFFGWSVAASGDSVAVGAPWEDSNANSINGDQTNNTLTQSGAAYVFVRSGNTWSQQAYLKPANPGFTYFFGWSVGISADLAVASALEEASSTIGINSTPNTAAAKSGAAYVFSRSGTSWRRDAYLKASNTGANDAFGQAVAISGNAVVVGANKEDSNATTIGGDGANNAAADAGAAYVFVKVDGAWSLQAYLKPANAETGDGFGFAVAIAGSTVLVGSDAEDGNGSSAANNSASGAGAAYGFVGLGRPTLEIDRQNLEVTLRWPAESAGWLLEATDDLKRPWNAVTGTPAVSGDRRLLTLPVDRPRRFFRLQ